MGTDPADEQARERAGLDTGNAIISASADGIVAVGADGRIRLCNPAAEELFGRPADDLLGSPFGFPIVAGGAGEVELMLPDGGERIVEMRVTDTTLDGERLHVAALRDVTRRRRVERELEKALERQYTTAAVVTHELRNPLSAISALTDALRDPAATLTSEERAEVLDRIADRAACMQNMVAKLLVAARIDMDVARAPRERVPLLELTLERLAEFGDRSREVRVTCASGLAACVNRDEMSEMLVNCLENAFAYGGPPIEVIVTEDGDWVDIRVRDHGPGVPEDFAPRLFDRFARDPEAGRRADGSGLGLWIVRRLALANGGNVNYGRAEEEGACFRITLRRAPVT